MSDYGQSTSPTGTAVSRTTRWATGWSGTATTRPPLRGGALRPAPARRRRRAGRRAPAVPHRHRHPVAGPARGARVTGLDFSAPALDVARRLAADCGVAIDYVESELYGAVDALGPAGSTSSTRGSARCAGCPTSAVGRGGRGAAPTGRAAVHPRGSSGPVVAGRPPPGRAAGDRVPVLRDRRRALLRERSATSTTRAAGVAGHRPLQPRPR